ncbi:MAG: hypothetical protein NTV02_03170 [Candidatus Zambryskibacteria bacterium]|nr:hypothetical protein [Candidatus Zambryskibacteria bacterium]
MKIDKRTQKSIDEAVLASWYRKPEIEQTHLWLTVILAHPKETTRADGLFLTVDTRKVRNLSQVKLNRISHNLMKAISNGLKAVFGEATSINFDY